jgi:predicted glutamine amidotransferase
VRATTGTAIQETNCHPFRHGRWLFVHNGVIAGFHQMRRELMLEVRPDLFPNIEGSTDSEVLFHLALTYGLEDDPVAALERAIGFVEATAERHGIEHPVQTSIGVTDGERLWALRYSTERRSRSLFVSTDARAVRELHPENPRLQRLRDEDRIVVSEPLADLPGVWQEIPESTVLVVQPGPDEQHEFHPRFEPAQPALS